MLITSANATNAEADTSKYAKITNIVRNMIDCKYNEDSKVVVPVRTISNPSPPKKSASNRHPGQTHTRTPVDEAIAHELAKARYLMHDLADHVFGHIVPTELTRDILCQLVDDEIVQVFEGTGLRNNYNAKVPLDPNSDDVRKAIQQAFEDADEHDCIQPDAESKAEEQEPTNTRGKEKQASAKGAGKQKMKTYSFKWSTFPAEPLGEDELVSFLNNITDRAFAVARPKLSMANPKLRHRFAAPEDKNHAIPLSYEPDGEDMRPDFLLLPIEAFTDGFKTVDPRYVNFTASRLVGESKNKDLAAGVEQMQRYARGLKRSQPWLYYVLGMTITKDKAVFLRGEGSGTERLELMLADGRGCIEFIRILLGLALADKVDLGHNPDVELEGKEQICMAKNVSRHSIASIAGSSKVTLRRVKKGKDQLSSVADPLTRVAISESGSAASLPSSRPCRTLPASRQNEIASSSTSSKRVHSEIADDANERTQPKKRKTEESVVEVNRFVFFPVAVYGYKCVGILFTASSIRGRGTTVFCVVDLEDKSKLLALKMAWQDLGRVAEQDIVIEKLMNEGPHPNLIVPFRTFKVERNGKTCTTLGAIRGFSDDQIGDLRVENRVLTISISELKRPVKYFWGVHDFVRGLRGALLGHEYLTKIGILHRDISENNIVLGLRPGDERGYLIDLDMAILQNAEEPTPAVPPTPRETFLRRAAQKFSTPVQQNIMKTEPTKGLRTGTFPYISYNVLLGGRHTHFDDVESFLYVLLLFFFSYAGPLSDTELHKADEAGFVQSIGSGRLSHMRNWPKEYADWADGDPNNIGKQKHYAVAHPGGASSMTESVEFQNCLEKNWPSDLREPISALVEACFMIFLNNTLCSAARGLRTEVSQAEFISTLDEWLDMYSVLEDKFSNCPFKQARVTESL